MKNLILSGVIVLLLAVIGVGGFMLLKLQGSSIASPNTDKVKVAPMATEENELTITNSKQVDVVKDAESNTNQFSVRKETHPETNLPVYKITYKNTPILQLIPGFVGGTMWFDSYQKFPDDDPKYLDKLIDEYNRTFEEGISKDKVKIENMTKDYFDFQVEGLNLRAYQDGRVFLDQAPEDSYFQTANDEVSSAHIYSIREISYEFIMPKPETLFSDKQVQKDFIEYTQNLKLN